MSNKPIAGPLLLLLIVAAVQAGCVHTEPFRDASGRVLENSIAEMSYAEIGGIRPAVIPATTADQDDGDKGADENEQANENAELAIHGRAY